VNPSVLEEAAALGAVVGHVFVATATAEGVPHLGAAGNLAYVGDDRIAITEWFCPGTMANLEENTSIAVVVWDAQRDTGHQLIGHVERVRERSMVDGYAADLEEPAVPQVERELIVRVDRVLLFSQAPHTDVPEDNDG